MAVGRHLYKDVLPFIAMVAMECSNVGVNTLFKAATDRGMSYYVFIVYSYSIAALLVLPFAFFIRKTEVPPLNSRIMGKLLLLGLIGSVALLCGYKGIELGSPTLASAMSNIVPAFTFILAIFFRMERLAWRSSTSQVKILGTVVSIAGALTVILYKGPSIIIHTQTKISVPHDNILHSSNSKWIIGGFLLGADYILFSVWYILQALIFKEYPAELAVVFFYNFFVAIICGAVSFVEEPERTAWVLKPGISLAAVLYAGLFGSCLYTFGHAWILCRKGPVYIAMFKPLSIAIAAGMGVMFLGETLHVGSIIGAAVISLGFYAVMWGKATEEIYEDFAPVAVDVESSSEKISLVKSSKAESS